ncbi:hypothetical protein [Faecalitalea cylindroides]|uniref:hypothetical protein n=1 Tax=Faecalitalea cylindroides TaxID=39483 RepID=UPI0026752879|nr:hypothetical protein [Faecalitalea cylindroides]
MYEIIKNVIDSGRFELVDILKKIDTIWLQGDITNEQRDELVELAREKADISQEVDILAKLEDHEQRLRKLEEGGSEPSDEYPEYIVGHWYYKDDKITFNEKNIYVLHRMDRYARGVQMNTLLIGNWLSDSGRF